MFDRGQDQSDAAQKKRAWTAVCTLHQMLPRAVHCRDRRQSLERMQHSILKDNWGVRAHARTESATTSR